MNEVATKETFSSMLTTTLDEVNEALPVDFNKVRFVQNAVCLLNDNNQLKEFAAKNGVAAIKAGMLKAAYLGLDFMNKEVYLIPFGKDINFMIDYRGSVKLCKKYSIRPIKEIYAKLVREGDYFSDEIVNNIPTITFRPKPFSNAPIIGAFAVVLYTDGGMEYDTMSKEELDKTRSKSKSSNSMAWKDFEGEMYKKTVLHRLCKHIEIDFATAQQRQIFDEDVAIETDVKETVKKNISANANTVDFDEDAIPVSAKEIDTTNMPSFLQ